MIAEIKDDLPESTSIEIWYQDEARIGQKTKRTRRWALRGSRPSAPTDLRTQSAYIFGAICPALKKAAGLVLSKANTTGMNLHLEEISYHVAKNAHAVVIVDRAAWHSSNDLAIPDNITLVPLPPKCPELNPVENIWQYMRDNWLSNLIFQTYDQIVLSACDAWQKLVAQPETIHSIGSRKWADV